MRFIGIDIAKETFVAAFPCGKDYKTEHYLNSAKGIKQLMKKLSKDSDQCVLEATGNYGMLFLYLLSENGYRVSMVNSKQIKHFSRMMLSVTKTDKIDAKLISMYGEKMTPPLFKLPTKDLMLLKQQRTVLRQLKKQITALGGLKESLQVLPIRDKKSMGVLNHTVEFLTKKIKYLEADMLALAEEKFEEQYKLLTSIKGIGGAIATALIVATAGFTQFDNAKQLSRYIGICPTYQQSGTSVNVKGHICKNGDSHLRAMLYIGSWSAIKHNTACKECYERLLSKGKPPKVALFAVANKLVRQAFAVCKENKPYIDGYCSNLTNDADGVVTKIPIHPETDQEKVASNTMTIT